MKKRIYLRLVFCFLVIIAATFFIYPPKDSIKLGLDLQGGMHLVLDVDIDDLPEGTEPQEAIDRALEIIRNRVDEFGVSEPIIQKQGKKRIIVQLPGIRNVDRAIELIGKTALLEFRLVDMERLGEAMGGKIPAGYELVSKEGEDKATYLLKIVPEITGTNLSDAQVRFDTQMFNRPYVSIKFDGEGAKKFAEVTGKNINKRLAIVLDNKVKSAPVIKSNIPDGEAVIEGNFDLEEAKDLAIVLRAGSLPAPIKIVEKRVVGPTLGKDSIEKGIIAGLIALLVVTTFMIGYYKFSGIIANLALLINLIIIFAVLSLLKATLTLPGIAGIILTIGVAVDANVIIYERIKEEFKLGKTIRAALDNGYKKAFRTILDSNLTTLIIALMLYQFGTGPIKGFAVTLSVGIMASMFTAIFVCRSIFDFIVFRYRLSKLSI
ncbi:MAG: protein translocase subunit SecD [bacterium]|nr:protein translocase subunit SecD [bacterium]